MKQCPSTAPLLLLPGTRSDGLSAAQPPTNSLPPSPGHRTGGQTARHAWNEHANATTQGHPAMVAPCASATGPPTFFRRRLDLQGLHSMTRPVDDMYVGECVVIERCAFEASDQFWLGWQLASDPQRQVAGLRAGPSLPPCHRLRNLQHHVLLCTARIFSWAQLENRPQTTARTRQLRSANC